MIPDLTQNYCWLICSLPLSLPVPAPACPCSTHAHMYLMTVLPHSVSVRIVSCPSTPFSLNFVYWAKALFRSVSLKVDQVTLFVSVFEYADFFSRCKLIHKPRCLDLPISPACDAQTCFRPCFSAFWHLSKNYSLLVFYLSIQSFSVVTNT